MTVPMDSRFQVGDLIFDPGVYSNFNHVWYRRPGWYLVDYEFEIPKHPGYRGCRLLKLGSLEIIAADYQNCWTWLRERNFVLVRDGEEIPLTPDEKSALIDP